MSKLRFRKTFAQASTTPASTAPAPVIAKLGSHRFAILGYRSQLETPTNRAITKAQRLRVRLGGGPSVLDPLPRKPPRVHSRTFFKRLNQAAEAQERSMALALEDLRRRFPEQAED